MATKTISRGRGALRARPQGALLLERWRTSLKLTQQEASKLVDLDPQTYNAFEKGRLRPGLKRAAKIAAGTGELVPIAAWAA